MFLFYLFSLVLGMYIYIYTHSELFGLVCDRVWVLVMGATHFKEMMIPLFVTKGKILLWQN